MSLQTHTQSVTVSTVWKPFPNLRIFYCLERQRLKQVLFSNSESPLSFMFPLNFAGKLNSSCWAHLFSLLLVTVRRSRMTPSALCLEMSLASSSHLFSMLPQVTELPSFSTL